MTQSNVAVWFEIPTADFPRAIRFYESVFDTPLKRERFGTSELAVFPHLPEHASGCLINGEGIHAEPARDHHLLAPG